MQGQNIIRTLLFVVFFSVGAAAVGGSVLCDDLVKHYRNKHYLRQARRLTAQLEALDDDYDALLTQLENDPNIIERLAPATLGADREEPNTAYPRATAQELATAKQLLAEIAEQEPNSPMMPTWLARSSEPGRRKYLFAAGAILILLSFTCFARLKPPDPQQG